MAWIAAGLNTAHGAILHPGQVPAQTPPDGLIGHWGGYASCVVVRPNYVLATKHQGGELGTSVRIDGTTYRVGKLWSHATSDAVLARIIDDQGQNPGLDAVPHLADGSVETLQPVAIGGWGRGRGEVLLGDGEMPYGYKWGPFTGKLCWGWNVVDRLYAIPSGDPSQARGIAVQFEPAGHDDALQAEVALAQGDSGGGWFLRDGDHWRLVGMSTSVEHSGESWFQSPDGAEDPDLIFGLRIAPLVDWIESIAYEGLIPGDANGDGSVDFGDYVLVSTHFGSEGTDWGMGDFTGDGRTNQKDLDVVLANLGRMQGPTDPVVPEPACLTGLLLAGFALARPRRAC